MTQFVYLASPYSVGKNGAYGDGDLGKATPNQKTRRFKAACKKAADLMDRGYVVFSPIAHSHAVEREGMHEVRDGNFWLAQDLEILKRCDRLFVYKLQGWDRSRGIAREVAFAQEEGIPIDYIEDDTPRHNRRT